MEFINEECQTSLNEPRMQQLLEQEQLTLLVGKLPIPISLNEVENPFESEDDDLALFGVGGPA